VSSDNPSSADNQQERPSSSSWLDQIPCDLGNWVAGFVDGEGSFNVPIRRERDRGLPWRVSLSFNVSQIGRELPELLRTVFGVGTVRDRGDGVHYFEVTRPWSCSNGSSRFRAVSATQSERRGSCDFRESAELVLSGRHLSTKGIGDILILRSPMNRGGKRRYDEKYILDVLRDWESSEAIRKAPSVKPGG